MDISTSSSLVTHIFLAVTGGFLSFLSPCVLPLVPGYLSFLAGYHEEEGKRGRSYLVLQAMSFVAGFCTIFVAMGMAAAGLSGLLLQWQGVLSQIAGSIILLFGLHALGIFKITALMRDIRPNWHRQKRGVLTSILAGLAFGMGWTPCIGPILAGILALAAESQSASKGAFLLFCYGAGLGLPFVIAAFGLDSFHVFTSPLKRHLVWIERCSGILLIITGLLILTGTLSLMSNFFIQWVPFLASLG